MDEIFVIYLLLGISAGLIAGMLGVGGGLIIVPVLVVVFQYLSIDNSYIMHLALGTSLATIVVTSFSAVIAHQMRSAVDWGLVFYMIPGLLIGAWFGAWFANALSSLWLQRLFGVFEVIIAIYMFRQSAIHSRTVPRSPRAELLPVSALIGAASALLGIGGGTMTVPYLSWRGISMQRAVAVSSACGIPIALAGCLGYVYAGLATPNLPNTSLGFIYWPALIGITLGSVSSAPLGARLAHALPAAKLRRVFAVMLILIGSSMVLIS